MANTWDEMALALPELSIVDRLQIAHPKEWISATDDDGQRHERRFGDPSLVCAFASHH